MRDKLIFLVLGAIISVLFGIFSGTIYEALYFTNGFSDAMFDFNIYKTVGIIVIIVTWAIAAIYYYVINSVKFDRWYHWLAMLGIASVAAPVICYFVVSSQLEEGGADYGSAETTFAFYNILVSALMFIIASFSMRWWSSNCRHTPIPQ